MHADGERALHIDSPIVDEERLGGPKPEPVEGAVVERRVGLQQLFLAGDDDVAEAAEEGVLTPAERRPEIGGEVGDGKERHTARVEFLDDGVDAGDGVGDRLAEALAPGRDQMGVGRKCLGKLGGGLVERPPRVERIVPAIKVDVPDEAQALVIVRDLADEETIGIPAVKDVADVEYDGGGRGFDQPWRALKRRFVLLMT